MEKTDPAVAVEAGCVVNASLVAEGTVTVLLGPLAEVQLR
jgi:hypothetical protein